MNALRTAFLLVIGVVFFTLALANREPIVLSILPSEMAKFIPSPPPIVVPAFVAIFGGVIVGLLIGFIWEWLREHRHRADSARRRKKIKELEAEVNSLKQKSNYDKDEILLLLE